MTSVLFMLSKINFNEESHPHAIHTRTQPPEAAAATSRVEWVGAQKSEWDEGGERKNCVRQK